MSSFDRLFSLSGLSLDRLRTFLNVAEAGNLSRAAQGDPNRQSQYSRQVKELEGFFGVALTRRVGRRIEITDEGKALALLIRRQFRELDDFRESMAGRKVTVRIGSQGSVIEWLLIPRLGAVRTALGDPVVELEQLRTLDVLQGVADGRLDFGILREDALPGEMKRWKLGRVGYSLFGASALCKGLKSLAEVIENVPMVELYPGGQFSMRWQEWLWNAELRPRVLAKTTSFTELAKMVRTGQAAAVLPDLAREELAPPKFHRHPVPKLKDRDLVLIANSRSLERSGLPVSCGDGLRSVLEWK